MLDVATSEALISTAKLLGAGLVGLGGSAAWVARHVFALRRELDVLRRDVDGRPTKLECGVCMGTMRGHLEERAHRDDLSEANDRAGEQAQKLAVIETRMDALIERLDELRDMVRSLLERGNRA